MNKIVNHVPILFYFSYEIPFFVTVTRFLPEVTSSFNSLYSVNFLTQYLTRFITAMVIPGVKIKLIILTRPPFCENMCSHTRKL